MSAPDPHPALAGPPRALIAALKRLARPLVRLLLDHRITWPSLASLLRETYVEMAEREFGIEGKPQTTTRVSLLTGIHRKEVRRLRDETGDGDATPGAASLGAQLVARWTGDPRFLDAEGEPRALPRRGAEPSFEGLVESVSKDIRSRAVLDEWLRLGVVSVDAQDRVALHRGAFVPERGFDEKAFFFGRNLRDHIAAAAHNLRGDGDALLERSVFYDDLSPEALDELEDLARELGERSLAELNRRAFALQQSQAADDGDASPGARERGRMTFGVFFYRGDDEERDD